LGFFEKSSEKLKGFSNLLHIGFFTKNLGVFEQWGRVEAIKVRLLVQNKGRVWVFF
jgi:hypothetical protein